MSDVPQSQSDAAKNARALKVLVVLVAAILIVAVAIVGVQIGRSKNASPATISVSATGTVKGTPNTVTFEVGVHTVAVSAKEALAQNNAKVAALIAALEKNGVLKKDMQTSGLDVYENTNNQGVITGFSVDNTLNVTMHNVGKSGAAIDAAANVVGNGIVLNGITFSISDQSALEAQARTQAMRNARRAASNLASAGGTTVSSIVRINAVEQSTQPYFAYPTMAGVANLKASVPVEAGQQSVSVTVSVVYALAS